MSGPKCGHVRYAMRLRLQSSLPVAGDVVRESGNGLSRLEAAAQDGSAWSDPDIEQLGREGASLALERANLETLIGLAKNAVNASNEPLCGELAPKLDQSVQAVKRLMGSAEAVCQKAVQAIARRREADEQVRLLATLKAEKSIATGWAGSEEWPGGFSEVRSWNTPDGLPKNYDEVLASADGQEKAGKLEDAIESCRAAGKLRQEMLFAAADAREQSRLRSELAMSFMQALCDRNYDNPVYGMTRPTDPLSNLRIEATVPNSNGKGNIHIEIELSGKVNLAIDGVESGEEGICRETIAGLQRSASESGADFIMDDWGRAASSGKNVGLSAARVAVRNKERY